MTEIVKAPVITPERQDEVLKYLGLDARDTATHALVEVCNRYGFDPLLKHVVLIGKGGSKNTYVTRDGLLHLAHQSHQLNGITVVEEGDTDKEWWAIVEVHRKDMTYPFRYKGRYSKSGANKAYGPEMAVKCAEVMALRRAFDVSLPTVEEQWDSVAAPPAAEKPAASVPPPPPPPTPKESLEKAREALQPPEPEPAGRFEREVIRRRMTADGVDRELRDEFRSKFGPVDGLSGTLLGEATKWVQDRTDPVERF